MTELKVTSKKYNDQDVLEVEDKPLVDLVNNVIEADKDIISKIRKVYDKDNDVTLIKFPYGILPLSFSINYHNILFKNFYAVNEWGEELEDYLIDEIAIGGNEEDNYISFNGDISEQSITGLVYINYNINEGSFDTNIIGNTYYLFYPQVGTKLYRYIFYIEDAEEGEIPLAEFILDENFSNPTAREVVQEAVLIGLNHYHIDLNELSVMITLKDNVSEFECTFFDKNDFSISPGTFSYSSVSRIEKELL